MEPHRNLSSFSSLEQLLEEIENLVALEFSKTGKPWMSVVSLSELFHQKHGVSLESILQTQDCSDSLRSFFRRSKRFSIYATSMPQKFYVALLRTILPNYDQTGTRPIEYQAKYLWKTKQISSQTPLSIVEYQPILGSEIVSIDDLEIGLMEILKSLKINSPEQRITPATLSQKFYEYYGQPIRAVMRSVDPGMKLIDLLRTMPNLNLQEVNNDWQITLKVDAME